MKVLKIDDLVNILDKKIGLDCATILTYDNHCEDCPHNEYCREFIAMAKDKPIKFIQIYNKIFNTSYLYDEERKEVIEIEIEAPKESFIMVNGEKIEISDEVAAELAKTYGNAKKNAFKRVEHGDIYYFIDGENVEDFVDDYGSMTSFDFYAANYCQDKELLQKRALEEILLRQLWRFSIENSSKEGEVVWTIQNKEPIKQKGFRTLNCQKDHVSIGTPFFDTQETAERAIKEVILPFYKKYPNFEILGVKGEDLI